jgi:hypothetical protein
MDRLRIQKSIRSILAENPGMILPKFRSKTAKIHRQNSRFCSGPGSLLPLDLDERFAADPLAELERERKKDVWM